MVPTNYSGKANWEGKKYKADFSQYQGPSQFADRLTIDSAGKTMSFKGTMTDDELKTLTSVATNPDQAKALKQLSTQSNWFDIVFSKTVIRTIKNLRTWFFVLCFLCRYETFLGIFCSGSCQCPPGNFLVHCRVCGLLVKDIMVRQIT